MGFVGRKLSEDAVNEVIRVYCSNEDLTLSEVGTMFGVTRTTIRNYLIEHGVRTDRHSPNRRGGTKVPLDMDKVIADYVETGSIERVADRHPVSAETIRRRLHKAGIKPMKGWVNCRPEYLPLYRTLMKKVKAAEARAMVNQQIECDKRRAA